MYNSMHGEQIELSQAYAGTLAGRPPSNSESAAATATATAAVSPTAAASPAATANARTAAAAAAAAAAGADAAPGGIPAARACQHAEAMQVCKMDAHGCIESIVCNNGLPWLH